MANSGDWVEEQESLLMMDRVSNQSEAGRLLEHSRTNRDITEKQGQLFTVARFFGKSLGVKFYGNLADECERAQMSIDNSARKDFMKVAIEQWQGKIQTKKEGLKALI